MNIVNIYTDGACSGNQNENNVGGWGCVLTHKKQRLEFNGGEFNTTNNRMELLALISALEHVKKGWRIRIFSDSAYLVNCFKKGWHKKWRKNGWRTASKKPVENRELWERLFDLLGDRQAEFYLIKGHLNLNWDEERLRKAYSQFTDNNGDAFSYEEFLNIAAMNIRCDELANVFINENRFL
ncbi:MAG TPA: ribonuclease H [Bacillota bacterium]|nr:ribonuclease H [Bacillota bacterium]